MVIVGHYRTYTVIVGHYTVLRRATCKLRNASKLFSTVVGIKMKMKMKMKMKIFYIIEPEMCSAIRR